MQQTPHYKLYFFNAMGRAEIIRLIFAHCAVPYEDIRLTKDEFEQKKDTFPFGLLPVLDEDGKILSQSHAIATYLAAKYGLNGANDWEAAKIQEFFGVFADLANKAIPIFRMPDGSEKSQKMTEFAKHNLAPLFKRLSKILLENQNTYFVGKQLTVADLNMLCIIGLFGHMFPDTIKEHENLKQFRERIMNLPNIKKWIETRPITEY